MTIQHMHYPDHKKTFGKNSSTFWMLDCNKKDIKNVRQWFKVNYNGSDDFVEGLIPVHDRDQHIVYRKMAYIVIFDQEIAAAFRLTFCNN